MPRDTSGHFLTVLEAALRAHGVSVEDAERVVAEVRRQYGGRRMYVAAAPPESPQVRAPRPAGGVAPPGADILL